MKAPFAALLALGLGLRANGESISSSEDLVAAVDAWCKNKTTAEETYGAIGSWDTRSAETPLNRTHTYL